MEYLGNLIYRSRVVLHSDVSYRVHSHDLETKNYHCCTVAICKLYVHVAVVSGIQ